MSTGRALAVVRTAPNPCRVGLTLCAVVTLGLAVGCRVELDHESLEGLGIGTGTERCVVEQAPGIDRGGAFSLGFPSGAYWIFADTWDAESGEPRVLSSSGATVTSGADPCTELQDARDTQGRLAEIVPLTAEEAEHNLDPPDGRRIALWPTAGFVHQGVGTIYFRKVKLAGYFDVVDVGVGVAHVALGAVGERTLPGVYPQEPTLLWLSPDVGWGSSAFVAPDGYAYVHGCIQRGAWDHVCRVARVLPADAADAAAYRYFDGEDWVPEAARAGVVLEGMQSVSVAFSDWRGEHLAVYPGLLDNRVFARSATSAQGPFGRADQLFVGTAPRAFWISGVVQHPAHASSDGHELAVSYYSDPESGPKGLRLVDVVLQ